MVPRKRMLVTKKPAKAIVVWLCGVAVVVAACSPPGPRALLKGKRLLDDGKTAEAVPVLTLAVSLLPTNAVAWNYLGLAYHRTGQWTNAAEAYSRALKLDRDRLDVRYNLGCLWLDADQLEPAKSEFIAYTMRRGNTVEGWLKLGAVQSRLREAADAEKSFQEALRVEPKNLEALNGLGMAQLQRKRPREAAESFAAALEIQADYRPALLNLAIVTQQHLHNRSEALRLYRQYLALTPRASDWEEVNAVAQTLEPAPEQNPIPAVTPVASPPAAANKTKPPIAATTNPEPARKSEPAHAAKTPSNHTSAVAATASPVPAPRKEIVKSHSQPVSTVAAAESRTQVARTELPTPATNATAGAAGEAASPVTAPNTGNRREAMLVLAQGRKALRADRLAEAIQLFTRATHLDPSYFEAHYRLGLAAFSARSFTVALAAWRSALALQPDNADARYNLALTLKAANQPVDAARELERLLAVHPDEARAYLTLGNLYAGQLHDLPLARKYYHQVLRLDPHNPQAPAIRSWLVANPVDRVKQ